MISKTEDENNNLKENIKPETSTGKKKVENKRCKSGKTLRYIDNNLHTFDALSQEELGKVFVLKNASCDKLQVIIFLFFRRSNLFP